MKRVVIILISLFIFSGVGAIEINSKSAILYNMNNESIIYEKNSHDIVQVASLTKIITAITFIENESDLEKQVVITKDMLKGLDGYAKAGLKVGDKLTYLDLLYALMLPSAADAANALAISKSGSIDEFANLMNQKVSEIGVTNSKFDNPIGMDSDDNYSTSFDMSKILIYSLKNETFKKIFNTNYYTIKSLNMNLKKTMIDTSNNNNLDVSIIKGAKTGYTDLAGMCLASTTEVDGVDYLLITLGADAKTTNNIKDTINIYKYYSENYGYVNILSKGDLLKTIKVKGSKVKSYDIVSKENIDLYLEKSITKDNLKYQYEGIEVLNRKIKNNDKLGTVKILNGDKNLYTYEVYLDKDIKYYNYILYITIIIFILIIVFLLRRKFNGKANNKRRQFK